MTVLVVENGSDRDLVEVDRIGSERAASMIPSFFAHFRPCSLAPLPPAGVALQMRRSLLGMLDDGFRGVGMPR